MPVKRKSFAVMLAILILLTACSSPVSANPSESDASRQPSESREDSSVSETLRESSMEDSAEESVSPAEPSSVAANASSTAQQTPTVNANPGTDVTGLFPDEPSTLLSPGYHDIVYIATFSPEDMTYVPAGMDAIQLLQTLRSIVVPLKDTAPTKPPDAAKARGLLLMQYNYNKLSYTLIPGGIDIGGDFYAISQAEYDKLDTALVNMERSTPYACPQWLYWLNPNRVVDMTVNQPDGTTTSISADQGVSEYAALAREVMVKKNTLEKYLGKHTVDKATSTVVTMEFDNSISYTVIFSGSYVYVESSDMSYGCRYELAYKNAADVFTTICNDPSLELDASASRANPATGKPVIYLYPESNQTINVKLDFKGEVTYTYPDYKDGWTVTAKPDGTLTNRSDNSTHYYLFWEGNPTKRDWDFTKGFVVKGEDTESFLVEKLRAMGLTAREYNDFVVYWAPELKQNAYNLITFAGAEYEEIAALRVTPTPDSVLRVHMVYKPISAPVIVQPQEFSPFIRTGFSLVEWSGTRAY